MKQDVKEIQLNLEFADSLPDSPSMESARQAREVLESQKGRGNDFLGWLDLPDKMTDKEVSAIQDAALMLKDSDAFVVVGIGGSYLGARAVIEALTPYGDGRLPIHWAGHHLDSLYLQSLLSELSGKRYSVNVISKSGTTTEPAVAFRFLWRDLLSRYGIEPVRKLVVATTDRARGSLKKLADREGLRTFTIPDDVGGRYSVFTAVGLLPIAVAGFNIRALVGGARAMMDLLRSEGGASFEGSPAIQYAAYRNAAYKKGKRIEVLASYQPAMHYISEWWKQLFGESEGKENQGIFPASVDLTTDLHSMGQWMQQGERNIFETVFDILERPGPAIPRSDDDEDGLNYLAGRSLHEVNRIALRATMEAHAAGGVPVARWEVPRLDEWNIGAMLYLFEYACGVSAYMQGVNPFDQPGVEAYKNNMFRMLGKPGHK